MGIIGVPEEETRIVGTEQSSEEREIKRATEFLEKLMGKKKNLYLILFLIVFISNIMIDFKISEVIHVNTREEMVHSEKQIILVFHNTKCQKIMEHFI